MRGTLPRLFPLPFRRGEGRGEGSVSALRAINAEVARELTEFNGRAESDDAE
jgi:hypothetical protein